MLKIPATMPSVCDGGNIEPFVMQIAEIEVLLCPWGIGEINLGPILIILNIYIYDHSRTHWTTDFDHLTSHQLKGHKSPQPRPSPIAAATAYVSYSGACETYLSLSENWMPANPEDYHHYPFTLLFGGYTPSDKPIQHGIVISF